MQSNLQSACCKTSAVATMPGYYDDTLGDEDEEARYPLFRSDSDKSAKRRSKTGASVVNSFLLIVILVIVVVASVYFQSQQVALNEKLGEDEATIQKLQQRIQQQGAVISRFNSSVTNADVVQRLAKLEYNLGAATNDLHEELDRTVEEMSIKLNQTMINLEETVARAEKDISDSVQKVKVDYEEFERKTNDQFSMENSFMIWQLAGTFTLLSCLISMWHMSAHLRKLEQPIIQRKILAILWMSPIYAVTSWFSLVFPSTEGYLAIVKDSYEAYVIYQGDREYVIDLLAKRADHLSPPVSIRSMCFCCCYEQEFENDNAKARAVLMQCQVFAMQFVFWRPVTTITKVVLKKYDYYGPWGAEGPNDWRAPQFYIFLIQNISIFMAFTGLLKFYHLVDKDLAWCRPFAKFLCIKGVVFMTFWQGLAISVLGQTIDETGGDPEEWATKSQNFLVCLEMLLFSLAHYYCFPTDEWKEDYKVNYQKLHLGDSIALGDFFSDLKLVMSKKKGHKKKKIQRISSQPTVAEGDEENDTDDDAVDYDSDDQNDDASHSTTLSAQRRLSKFLDDMTFSPRASGEDIEAGEETSGPDTPVSSSKRSEFKGDGTPTKRNGAPTASNDVATERTGLLPVKKSQLKPSVFTTVADIAERSIASGEGGGSLSGEDNTSC
eukprot:scaffold11532_cov119-Cylindrotheca_fusiformis.AAC.3